MKCQCQYYPKTGTAKKTNIGIIINFFNGKVHSRRHRFNSLSLPYTDLSNTKKRPVVIISKDAINKQNFIVSKITSVIRNDQFTFTIKDTDTETKLRFKSEVRTNEIFTVHKSLIIKNLTSFKKEPLKQLTEKIKKNISVD